MTLKSQPGGWILSRKPDLCIARSAEPVTLTLEQAVEWVRRNRPALWIGSIFSVPEPSGFPSGYALTRSLLDMIFPPGDGVPEPSRTGLIDSMIGKWPLERLLDEFELLHYDLSESLLDFFAKHDQAAAPFARRLLFGIDHQLSNGAEGHSKPLSPTFALTNYHNQPLLHHYRSVIASAYDLANSTEVSPVP